MTFLHPLFLVGLAAAVVPLLLHVIQTQRIRKVYFSTLHFLKMVHRRRSMRIRVSRLLLLLARMGLAAALTMAFAQPYFSEPALAFLNAGPRTIGVLWDNAGSTRAVDGGVTVLETMRGRAGELLHSLGGRDNLVIVASSPVPSVVFRGRSADFDVAKLPGATAAAADRARACEVLEEAMRALTATENVVAVFSDFRAGGWPAGVRLPKDAKVLLFPARLATYANWSLAHVDATPPAVAAGEPITINLTLAFYSTKGPQSTTLTVKVDGKVTDTRAMASSPEPIRTQVVLKSLPEGVHHVQLALSADNLPLDDTRELSVRVLPYRRVLIVNGKKRATPSQDEGWFLRRVLGTATDPRRGFLAREVTDLAENEDLRDVQLVVLADVKSLTDPQRAKLAHFVDRGGTLLTFLGDQTDVARTNAGLLAWTGFEVDRRAESQGPLALDEAAFGRLEALADESFWKPVAVDRFWTLRVKNKRPDVAHPVTQPDGTPFLLTASRGAGLAIFVNASASAESSDLPMHAVYPVLVGEASRLSTGMKLEQYLAGERVVLPLSADDMNAVLTVQDPAGKLTALKPGHSGETLFAAYDQTTEPGLYQFTRRTPDESLTLPFLVVPPPRESDLAPIPSTDLPARFPGATVVEGKTAAPAVASRGAGGLTLTDLLVWAAVVLVALELYLVWDLERHLARGGSGEAATEGADVH